VAEIALDPSVIGGSINQNVRPLLGHIEILGQTDSTNDVLLRLAPAERHARVVLAERQTAGKGRRGRQWQSPGGNIYMSLGWRFDEPAISLGALGLVTAVSVCRALARTGLVGHGIKWPNDIQVSGGKLGGILVELSSRVRSGCDAVIGIGINVGADDPGAGRIDQPWTNLSQSLGRKAVDRNQIVGMVLAELLECLRGGAGAFEGFLAVEWPKWDLLGQREVRIEYGESILDGTAQGIAPGGALRVLLGGGRTAEFHSGEVSVRRA
jgi:BirA family biotin operon repressor/biotin-[acetyl-CoA-carboxylase] ligase